VSQHPALSIVRDHVVTPVVRESDTERARRVVAALREGGFRVFEITMSVPGAIDLIAETAQHAGLTVGVGTVLDHDDARRAVAAGATFVVSPAFIPAVLEAAHAAGAAAILGAATPTEVHSAWSAGADAVKVFPAASFGGPSHLRALKSVFPDVPLIPTGDVDLTNLAEYLAAGAHSVGVGGALCKTTIDALPDLARRYLAAAGAKAAPSGKDRS